MKNFSKVLFAVTSAAALFAAPVASATESSEAAQTVSAKGAVVEALNSEGASTAANEGGTELTLKGSGFQAIKGGAGGVYVMFGWVSDPESMAWSPTNGGTTGANYRYAPDAEDETNAGYTRYVAFEGSKTAAAANGGFVNADGTWETNLMVPASKFESMDRDGNPTTVDCEKEICGVITIGAHGTKNGNNETFTPITFVADTAASAEPAIEESTEATQETSAPAESASPETSATESEESQPKESSATDSSESTEAEEDASPLTIALIAIGGIAVLAVVIVLAVKKSKSTTYND